MRVPQKMLPTESKYFLHFFLWLSFKLKKLSAIFWINKKIINIFYIFSFFILYFYLVLISHKLNLIEFGIHLAYLKSHILFSAPWQPTHPLVPTPLPPREWIWPTALLTWDWRPKSTASTRCPLSIKPEMGDEMRGQREAKRHWEEKNAEELD